MTTDELRKMFLDQAAWDRHELDKDVITKLVEAITILTEEIQKLNAALNND